MLGHPEHYAPNLIRLKEPSIHFLAQNRLPQRWTCNFALESGGCATMLTADEYPG